MSVLNLIEFILFAYPAWDDWVVKQPNSTGTLF